MSTNPHDEEEGTGWDPEELEWASPIACPPLDPDDLADSDWSLIVAPTPSLLKPDQTGAP